MHPGWLMPCFDVADLALSLEFYTGLGFRRVGGKPDEGWAIVANGPIERGLYCGHFKGGGLLNFRDAHGPALAERFAAQGIPIISQSRYDEDECGDCLIHDPDGRTLYFDTYAAERTRFIAGESHSTDSYDGSYTE